MPSLPPHEKTSEWLHIRIHKNPKEKDYQTFCERQFDSYISCYETHSNRPHVHILVKKKISRSLQIADMLKKLFNFFGNTDFSVGNVAPTADDLQNISNYVCKGDNKKTLPCVVFCSLDWTEEKIKYHHTDYHKQNHLPEPENKAVNIDHIDMEKLVKIPRKTWYEKVLEQLESDHSEIEWDYFNEKHVKWMVNHICEKLGNAKKKLNKRIVNDLVQGAFNYLDAKNYRTDMEQQVYLDIISGRN